MENILQAQFQYLLAGFVAAWVFYGLVPYKRPTPFERIVQALVYTAIVQALVVILAWVVGIVGLMVGCGEWGAKAMKILSSLTGITILAIIIGCVFAFFANNGFPHNLLRKLRLTLLTSRKSNWADVFDREHYQFIILNLKNGRRLYGSPQAWPDFHSDDHFLMANYQWVSDGKFNKDKPSQNAAILIAAEEVDTVELLFEKTIRAPIKGESCDPLPTPDPPPSKPK